MVHNKTQEGKEMTTKKNLQIQLGISVKHIAIDVIIDNEGLHTYIDTLGDITKGEGLK